MERLFAGTDKIILNAGAANGAGVVPYLPLNELSHPPQPGQPGQPAPTGGSR